MREIRSLRSKWRGLETGLRQLLNGHEEGNLGYKPRRNLRGTAPVLDPTNQWFRKPMASSHQKATRLRTVARVRSGPAESKTPCMQRNSMRENRETPLSPTKQHGGPGGERDER